MKENDKGKRQAEVEPAATGGDGGGGGQGGAN